MKRIKRPVRMTSGGMGYPSSIKEGQVQAKYVAGKGVVMFARVNGQIIEFPGRWQRKTKEPFEVMSTLPFGYAAAHTLDNTGGGGTAISDVIGYWADNVDMLTTLGIPMPYSGSIWGVSISTEVTDINVGGGDPSIQILVIPNVGAYSDFMLDWTVDAVGVARRVKTAGNFDGFSAAAVSFNEGHYIRAVIRLSCPAGSLLEISNTAVAGFVKLKTI